MRELALTCQDRTMLCHPPSYESLAMFRNLPRAPPAAQLVVFYLPGTVQVVRISTGLLGRQHYQHIRCTLQH